LHGVAVRVSRELLAGRQRRRTEPLVDDPAGVEFGCPAEQTEVAAAVDAEVAGLPAHYRAPVVLCELLGRSRRDAARELGVPEGTVASRLATAPRVLADRLAGGGPGGAAGRGGALCERGGGAGAGRGSRHPRTAPAL